VVAQEIIGKLLSEGSWSGRVRNARRDGTAFWGYASVSSFTHWRFGPVWLAVHHDATREKQLEDQQAAQLRRLDAMARITRLSLAAGSLDEMLGGVLDVVLDLFGADRAWFLHPCTPESPTWSVPMERTRPEWPGALAIGQSIPMSPEVAAVFRELLGQSGVLQYGPGTDRPIPTAEVERFHIRSQMQTVLRPKVGGPWVFGIHHCREPRLHAVADLELFGEIAQRITDGLSSLLSLRSLHEALAEAQRFREAHDRVGAYVFMKDLQSRFLYANQPTLDLFKVTADELVGQADDRFFPAETVEQLRKVDQRVFAGERTAEEIVVRDPVSGRRTYYWEVKTPIYADPERKRVCGLLGMSTDITARKDAERQVQEMRDELAGILDAMPDLLFDVGLDGRIHDYRSSRRDLLAAPPEQFLGKLMGEFLPEAAARECLAALQEANATGRSIGREYELPLGKDRKWFELSVARKPGRPAADPRFIFIARDITARKQAAQLHLIMDKLESTGILAGGLAHDFNNLLASIVLNLSLAGGENLPRGQLLERLEQTKQAALAGKKLTEQLITFAEGGMLDRKRHDLSPLLTEAVTLAMAGSNLRPELDLAEGLHPVEVDAGQFGQVIRNLVLNAREAMPEGGRVVIRAGNTRVVAGEVTGLAAGDYVRISVVDEGHGIPAELLPKIFDPYFSTKHRGVQKGMGLGLTICHSIVQRHGGAITVESEVGKGSAFHVYLPAAVAPPPSGQPAAASVTRVLIMDDDDFVRQAMGGVLEGMGYEVGLAQDGQQALELFQAAGKEGRPYGVVVLDLTVRGGMGGRETLPELRKLDPAVRAVVMSGYSNDEVLRNFSRHGFQAALTKPFELSSLKRLIEQLSAPHAAGS
jgi:PAS domain S-box-containing protein